MWFIHALYLCDLRNSCMVIPCTTSCVVWLVTSGHIRLDMKFLIWRDTMKNSTNLGKHFCLHCEIKNIENMRFKIFYWLVPIFRVTHLIKNSTSKRMCLLVISHTTNDMVYQVHKRISPRKTKMKLHANIKYLKHTSCVL